MSTDHPEQIAAAEQPGKTVDLTAIEGEPTSRSDIAVTVHLVDLASARVTAELARAKMFSVWSSVILAVLGVITAALVAYAGPGNGGKQSVLFITLALLSTAVGITVGLFISLRSKRWEQAKLNDLEGVLRNLPQDSRLSPTTNEGEEAGDRDV